MTILPEAVRLLASPHHRRMMVTFMVISFIAIFSTALILSTTLSRYIVDQIMLREAVVSTEFLNSVVHVENATGYFVQQPNGGIQDIEEFLSHVSRLPDVFRANIYATDGEVLWSSDEEIIGERFPENSGLKSALAGVLEPELEAVDPSEPGEHMGFPQGVTEFIEFYIPIRSSDGSSIIGAVEVYKTPADLFGMIKRLRMSIWMGAVLAATALFGALSAVMTNTSRVLLQQEARLVESERLAVVGEMASAVAHGLRNPLASIRSCAELTLDDDIPEASRTALNDITDQVDRLERWIRDFLNRSRRVAGDASDYARIDVVIGACIENFKPQLERRGIELALSGGKSSVAVQASAPELEQVLNSIISNGIEAMQQGGVLGIKWAERNDGTVEIRISDSGPGIPPEMLERVFTPFETSKASGVGVGLSLGRRIAERMGGTLELANGLLRGVEVTLRIPAAT